VLPYVDSNDFDIDAAAPASLNWVIQPTDTQTSQIMAAFTVQVIDQYSNNVPNVLVSITTTDNTLIVYQGGSPVPDYATATTDSNGIATFDTISLTQVGTGYIFAASVGAVPPEDSDSFAITP
jgi:hypothetical protein